MMLFLLNTLLALAWIALTGNFTPGNLVFGFIVGFIVLWRTRDLMPASNYFRKVPQVIGFIAFFLFELIKANFRMAWIVLTLHRGSIRPAVVAIPLDTRSDFEITMLANLITLTPGTLFLDVSQDRSVIYVHTIYVDDLDTFRSSIKNGFERRVMEVFQ